MPTSRTVLVADDDAVTRQLLKSLLETEEGYRVLFAENGAQALELATRSPPDVVLLDIVMPGIDGFEVCRQLRANPVLRHVPILLLTGLEDRNSRLRGLEAGADEFLNKPVDLIELRTRIRTITQLNRFRQLSDERARFQAAIAHSPVGIVLTDGAGLILNSNAAFAQLIGRLPPGILECFPIATADNLRARLATLDAPGQRVETFETPLHLSTHPNSFAEITVVRLPWSEGTMLEFTVRDITDRKQLEMQLARFQRIELLGQLAGGVVHDVNNLLMAVIGNCDLIEATAAPDAVNRARIIRQSAEQGAALLRRILMFARGADQDMTRVQVGPVLRETASIAAKLLGPNISLAVDVPSALPDILGDTSQLHQVVMNLCVNARDAMPQGGNLVVASSFISLNAAEARKIGPDATAGDFVAVAVRDTGIGIPTEIHDRLFDPFFTTKPRETSTGLGLATVLRIMQRHHGFIAFQTELNDGTCFTCYFPALSLHR